MSQDTIKNIIAICSKELLQGINVFYVAKNIYSGKKVERMFKVRNFKTSSFFLSKKEPIEIIERKLFNAFLEFNQPLLIGEIFITLSSIYLNDKFLPNSIHGEWVTLIENHK